MQQRPVPSPRRAAGTALVAAALALAPGPAAAAGLMEALSDGTASADLRYRYEMVDQGGFAEDAAASTLRTRLGYRTGKAGTAQGFLEFENVTTWGPDDYNSTTNGKTTYPTVADPEGSELNQAYVDLAGQAGVTVRTGRQRIKLDNDRFVGNVGWRQNEQTFDGVRLIDAHAPGMTFTYAYVWNVNGITGGDADHDTHLAHLKYTGLALGDVSLYGYLVNDNDAPSTASETYGVRYAGRFGAGPDKTLLNVEYARQGEYADSGIGDNDYLLGEAGLVRGGWTALVGYEVLGGDGTSAVQTPLATKHAFNGWADKFLATPAAGLVDLSATLSGTAAGLKLAAVYHDFSSDSGSTDYGTEWDLLAQKRLGAGHTVGLKYASYSADAFGTDTEKLWLYAGAAF